jgi:hypothetical protein
MKDLAAGQPRTADEVLRARKLDADRTGSCRAGELGMTVITGSGVSEPSVKRYLRNVFDKLGAVSRIDAVNKAIAASLIAKPELRTRHLR